MKLIELKNLIDKKINYYHYPKDAEVFINGNVLDNIVDIWTCANGKIAIVGSSIIEQYRKMDEEE